MKKVLEKKKFSQHLNPYTIINRGKHLSVFSAY